MSAPRGEAPRGQGAGLDQSSGEGAALAGRAEFARCAEAIQRLVAEIDRGSDEGLKVRARTLVARILELHGAALGRLLEILGRRAPGPEVTEDLAADEVVASVLLLHGLHPHPLAARVKEALDRTAPAIAGLGLVATGSVLDDGMVRIQLAPEPGVPPAATRVQRARALLEDAFAAAAPDAGGVLIEEPPDPGTGFVPVARLRTRKQGTGRPR